MQSIGRILLSGLIGGIVCAVIAFLMFLVLTISDGNKVSEAVAYSLIVGVGCALVGAVLGLVIGVGNLGIIGGGAVGFLATLCVVTLYVFFVGRPGQYGYFFGESRIIFLVLTLPLILTGVVTALLKNLIYKH